MSVGESSSSSPSDSELDHWLCATAAGDLAAFNRLFAAMRPMAHRRARQVLIDAHHAEEVAQAVMLEVWLKAAAFDPARGSARGWMAQIAYRRAVDKVRQVTATRRREQRAHLQDPLVHLDPDPSTRDRPGPGLAVAIAQLTVRQREALTLAFETQLTYVGFTVVRSAASSTMPTGVVKP